MALISAAISYLFLIILLLLIVRVISRTSLIYILFKSCQSVTDRFHVYQYFKVPQHDEHFQENQLYRKISIYLNSLSSIDDSDFTNLFSGTKPGDIFLHLDSNQTVRDSFLGAKLSWTIDNPKDQTGRNSFVLKLKKKDKRRVFRQYLQHILSISDEIELRKKEIKLYMNLENGNGRWRTVPFTHPASFDTVVLDVELKNKVKYDLENFLKSKQYYHRLGRVWKRSYLLYGQSGTGKTSFVAAMAKFLCYDVYEVDMSKVTDDSDLKLLMLQTTPRSLIVIEDLDRFLMGRKSSGVSLSGVLNFMDGISSCCGEERVMVMTMNSKDQIDEAILRPGRVDVHIEFPLCDFTAFKSLASSYLGIKEHKLFNQVEEILQSNGASLSPAEMGEIMINNRNSPSRALKSVISALQSNGDGNRVNLNKRLSESRSGRSSSGSGSGDASETGGVFYRESINTVREFRKLYGLLRLGSSRKKDESLHSIPIPTDQNDASRNEA